MQTQARFVALPSWIRTFCRFGFQRRRVARREWLRALPKSGSFRRNNRPSPRNISCARIPAEFRGRPETTAIQAPAPGVRAEIVPDCSWGTVCSGGRRVTSRDGAVRQESAMEASKRKAREALALEDRPPWWPRRTRLSRTQARQDQRTQRLPRPGRRYRHEHAPHPRVRAQGASAQDLRHLRRGAARQSRGPRSWAPGATPG